MIHLSFVHASSESGDQYYFVFDELLTTETAKRKVQERVETEGWDEEILYVEHVEQVSRDCK